MPTPIREAMQMVAKMHTMADEIFTTEKAFPSTMDVTERQVQVATYVRGMLMSWDRNPAMYDMTEVSDPLPTRKPMEASAVRSDGEKPVAPMKMNPYAIVVKRLEERGLSKKQYAVLVELVVASRRMTRDQHQKTKPSDLKRWVRDLAEEDLVNYVIAEGVV